MDIQKSGVCKRRIFVGGAAAFTASATAKASENSIPLGISSLPGAIMTKVSMRNGRREYRVRISSTHIPDYFSELAVRYPGFRVLAGSRLELEGDGETFFIRTTVS